MAFRSQKAYNGDALYYLQLGRPVLLSRYNYTLMHTIAKVIILDN
jgi:hypothetical protein